MNLTHEQLEIAEEKIKAYQELCKQIETGINAINLCNDIAQVKEFARLMYKSLLFTEITIEEMDAAESEPLKPNRFAGCDRVEDVQGDR